MQHYDRAVVKDQSSCRSYCSTRGGSEYEKWFLTDTVVHGSIEADQKGAASRRLARVQNFKLK